MTRKKKITNECLNDFLQAGLNPSVIARTCNMSRQAIHQRINYKSKHLKKKKLAARLVKQGFSPKEISKKLGHKTVNTTYEFLRKLSLRPASNRRAKQASIVLWASKGYDCWEIAKEINTSYQSVYWIARRRNIKIVKITYEKRKPK